MRRITGRQGDIKYSQWIWDYCSGDINHQKGEKKKPLLAQDGTTKCKVTAKDVAQK